MAGGIGGDGKIDYDVIDHRTIASLFTQGMVVPTMLLQGETFVAAQFPPTQGQIDRMNRALRLQEMRGFDHL